MRIRKNAKLTPSIIWSTAATAASPNPPEELMHSHVCVVNRSPWDVPSPPRRQARDYLPSLLKDDINLGNNNYMNSESGRRSLNEGYIPPPPSAAAVNDSCQRVDSMKLSSNYEHKSDLLLPNNNNNSNDNNNNNNNNIGDSVKSSFLLPHPFPSPLVPNGDEFSNGFWEEPKGETMVVDGWAHPHLHPTEEGSPVGKLSSPHDFCSPPAVAAVATSAAIERNDSCKNYSDEAAAAATVPPKRRGRPRKAAPPQQQQQQPQQAATAAANPYEYYYYAGFGPRWGKRRGVDKADNTRSSSPTTTTSNLVKRKNNILHPMSFRGGTSAVTGCSTAGGSTSTSSSYYLMEINDDDDEDEPMADYIDDDDDDDDDAFDGCSGAMDRKRVRKPIKARSLKSLIA